MTSEQHDASESLVTGILRELSQTLAVERTRLHRVAASVHPALTGAGFVILQIIQQHGEFTAAQLAQKLMMDKSLVSRHIAELRRHNLVICTPSTLDGRVVLIEASERAREALQLANSLALRAYRERFDVFSRAELQELFGYLQRLNLADDILVALDRAAQHARE
ncbi:MarR family transcriptional regulator [Leucobacter sp. UT-8R-CII-1-4]|uniref:MarR family winged helix-turn-helix transcriptional regulator n=1 Tax=Leucobacter sp. UT-8R-CII-1-4 TaxID=3040075 RepID=UPI0024A7BB19|nr:MarR family transcriptional regulator [Leucobacter sp. UT-8R-CII-1-4]MDI6021978.1 MarR family transcriptional regulator [Leucobacter sp. UT-8R-CII-1-4]